MLSCGNSNSTSPSLGRRLIKAWNKRKLRLAMEKHAYWKARAEEARAVKPSMADEAFGTDRSGRIESAAQEARYAERVEFLLRNQ